MTAVQVGRRRRTSNEQLPGTGRPSPLVRIKPVLTTQQKTETLSISNKKLEYVPVPCPPDS